MAQEKRAFPVRSASIPVFYKNFHCLAQKCRDSCCVDWTINFDKKDYLRLRRLEAPADLKERLEGGVRRVRVKTTDDKMYGCFDLKGNGGRCPFLDPDGLCAIQRACGHEALPHVCTSYPRHVTYSPAAKGYSLSPSCEGVLEQLWELPEGIKFIEEPLPKTEHYTVNVLQGETLMRYYAPIRGTLIGILQNRALSLTQRMLYLGITIQRLQKENWTSFDPDKWGSQTISLMNTGTMKQTLEKITGNRAMYIVQNLKVLGAISDDQKEDWFEILGVEKKVSSVPGEGGKTNRTVHQLDFSLPRYEEALAEFEKAFSGQEYFFENLMVAAALYLDFPSLADRDELWKGYVSLCNLYSFYRFTMISGCKGNTTKERLFHIIVMASRLTLHSRERFRGFQEELFQNDSSTLAHMAILLNG